MWGDLQLTAEYSRPPTDGYQGTVWANPNITPQETAMLCAGGEMWLAVERGAAWCCGYWYSAGPAGGLYCGPARNQTGATFVQTKYGLSLANRRRAEQRAPPCPAPLLLWLLFPPSPAPLPLPPPQLLIWHAWFVQRFNVTLLSSQVWNQSNTLLISK